MLNPSAKCLTAAALLLVFNLSVSSSSPGAADADVNLEEVSAVQLEDGDIESINIDLHVASGDSSDADETLSSTPLHVPPNHFHITSHVQTNLATGVSYFLPPDALANSYANIPFLECGAIGSTTEGVPLVSGVFRHVPNCGVVDTKRDVSILLEDDDAPADETVEQVEIKLDGEQFQETQENSEDETTEHHPKRPSPPRYVVALSPFEITVGGNGNQTQVFAAGDVIFMEDSWWGIWNEEDDENTDATEQNDMKGYIMRAHPDSKQDLNVMMLTVPPSVHRHWKNAHQNVLNAEKEMEKNQSSETMPARTASASRRQPWWKQKLHRHTSLPKPCSLESDPAFANPAASSTTLAQHFTQHFVKLLQGFSHPQGSAGFLPHQDLLFPILAQGVAGAIGGATAFGLVLQLWRIVPVQVAVGFGAACVVVFGTWGFVWLGEEVLDEMEYFSGRRRLERRWSKRSERVDSDDENKEDDL